MIINIAKALKSGNSVYDSEGTEFIFMELDEQNDLVVECRAAINGRITLDRAACTVDDPCRLWSVYGCEMCDNYVPTGNEFFHNGKRMCADCFQIILDL